MSDGLQWLRDIVERPIEVERAPGQMDLGLVVERLSDVCACGGLISVDDDGDVMEAVARHIQSNRHREWSKMGGLALPTDPEMFGRIPVDVADI